MRHAADQLSKALQPLGLLKLALELFFLGNVLDHRHPRGPAAVVHLVAVHVGAEKRAVLLVKADGPELQTHYPLLGSNAIDLVALLLILGRVKVAGLEPSDLLERISK